jgi:beta-glucosidase
VEDIDRMAKSIVRTYFAMELNVPFYPLGRGLSCSTFEYTDLQVSKEKFSESDAVDVTFTSRNTSTKKRSEIAQLQVQEVKCSIPARSKS